jgi:peptidoglycan/xylan/chitin deacetylase (PgdA/CDA1 family)
VSPWPGNAHGALSLSFDNLGVDEGSSATQSLPGLLRQLGEHNLRATFFVEGVNAERDPAALREIGAAGHEVAYHAWRHETWAELSAQQQAANLDRGPTAFEPLGLTLAGFRPPGGQLGPGGIEVLRNAGFRYCSPAGDGAGVDGDVALLPFQWRHVDATCLLPPLAPVREQMTGSPEPVNPDAFRAYCQREIEHLLTEGGFMVLVLHLPLIGWLGEENLAALLSTVASTGLWTASCDEVAEHLLVHPEAFADGATLDPTSWAKG